MNIKKIVTTSLLIISILTGINGNPGFQGSNQEAYAKAATVNFVKLCKPSVSVGNKSGNTNILCINKVQGATEYKIYRADKKNGTYKCIGTTKNKVYKDAVKGNKPCYYKVKACKKMNNKKISSPYSEVVSTQPQEKKPIVSVQEPSKTQSNEIFTVEVLKLVNQERAKVGLKALTTTDSLQKAANKRATEIATSFSHTRPDGRGFVTVLAENNITYRAAGENIAEGQKTPEEVMKGWMNSSGHKANILGSQFGKVGIGVYKGSNGRYYWTQVFTD